jgi:hypothetical protein
MYILNYAVRRPREAAFVRHEDRGHQPPIIYRDQRSRIGVERVCLTEHGTTGARWGNVGYLDIGPGRKAITIVLDLEFDFIDKPNHTIRGSITRTIDPSQHGDVPAPDAV